MYRFVENGIFGNANVGVNFFFVLSGFLITFLLIEEKKLNGQINIILFWKRRILRIWPLFYFCVFFGFVIFPLLKQMQGQAPNETADVIYYLTFLNNFNVLQKGLPDASVLSVLWSIAVEEQFYFLWPFIIFCVPLNKLWLPFLMLILGSLIFRAYYDTPYMHEFHTFSCMGDLTTGAMGAWLMQFSDRFKSYIERLSRYKITFIYILFFFLYFQKELLYVNYEIRIFERLFLAVVILFIILEQTFSNNSVFKVSKLNYFSHLGEISYGLYCLHFIGILTAITITKKLQINTALWQVFIVDTLLGLAFTILLSKLSYKYLEAPFLKLKDKYAFITK